MIFDEDVEFLEHYGVLGMHWGVRNKITPIYPVRSAFKDNKTFNRSHKTKTQLQKASSINKARSQIKKNRKSHASRAIRTQYQLDRKRVGEEKAREILRSSQRERHINSITAQAPRSGIEAAARALIVGGTVTIAALSVYKDIKGYRSSVIWQK